MARGINKVIIVGNLGNDPEMRYMPSGSAIANLSVATTDSWKDKQSGQQQEQTEWHRVVFFNRLAEIAGEYLRKGSQVYIEGSLKTRKWTDKSGNDRYTTEIVGKDMQMMGGRSGGEQAGGQSYGGDNYGSRSAPAPTQQQQQQPQPQPQQQRQQSAPPPAAPFDASNDFDDDIPF